MPRIGVGEGRLSRSASAVTGVGAVCAGGGVGGAVLGGAVLGPVWANAKGAAPRVIRMAPSRAAKYAGRCAMAAERLARVAHTPFIIVCLLLHGCAAVVGISQAEPYGWF